MKNKLCIYIFMLFNVLYAQEILPLNVNGEYDNDNNHGFMMISKLDGYKHNVWLGIGSGSCGGDTMIDNKALLLVNNQIITDINVNNDVCQVKITFSENSAYVENSCISEEDEEGSTCAMLGRYNQRINN